MTLVAPVAVRPALAKIVVPSDAPKYDAILTEFGYGPSEIDDLVSSGAAGRTWSAIYLPT